MAEHFTSKDRDWMIADPNTDTFRKTARIVAVHMDVPFTVETDRGTMTGAPGDWLVTNHPDDDPGSDVWSISDARMRATYGRVG